MLTGVPVPLAEETVPEVECSRCRRTAEGLPAAPLPGDAGQLVAEKTCSGCWQEWLGAQVVLINEHSLSPANPEHFERLLAEMRGFLVLDGEG